MSTRMTCEEFDDKMMDELYGELDAAGSDALAEHAAECASCAAKISKLRATRSALGSLEITPPADMESRILAAAAAAEAAMSMPPATPSNVIALPLGQHAREMAPPPAPRPEQGGKVFAFLSKPQLAAAAVVILVLGAAAFTTVGMSMKRSPMAASEADNAPAAVAASAATPVPMQAAAPAATMTIAAQDEPAPAASAAPIAATPPPPPAATMAGGGLAFNDPNDLSGASAQKKSVEAFGASAPAPRPRAVHAPPAAAGPAPATKPAAAGGKSGNGDFDTAKRLADSGRCGEALPILESLAPSDPRADLLAARCTQRTRGCVAATARYDEVLSRNSGNPTGATAAREKQQCQAVLDQAEKAEAKPGAGTPSTHAKPAKPAADPSPPATSTTKR